MKDVSDRRSFAVESVFDGLKITLENRKGTDKLVSTRKNIIEKVQDPSRFGMSRPPETFEEFYGIACRYFAEVAASTAYARKHTRVIREDGSTRAVR